MIKEGLTFKVSNRISQKVDYKAHDVVKNHNKDSNDTVCMMI